LNPTQEVIDVKKDVLLFDLGGVLSDFTGLESIKELLPKYTDLEDLRKRWLLSPSIKKFETGKCNAQEFASQFIKEWKLGMTPSLFLAEFKTWVRGPYDGALNLLYKLKTEFTLACLTNCNEIHWSLINHNTGFGSVFHHLYSSHQIGFAKPDIAAFEYVLSDLEIEPTRVLFFDDSQMNVDNARSLGIGAFKVSGLTGLFQKLKELGIII
jgi:putative hydrolase of the HAD superfamily